MKKYVKIIPLILYPYVWLIWLFALLMAANAIGGSRAAWIMGGLFGGVAVAYHGYVFFLLIYNFVSVSKGWYDARDAAKRNAVVKCCQIPAYIFYLLLELAGFVLGIFGIPFLVLAVCVKRITILLSGVYAVGCAVALKKEGRLSMTAAVLMSVGSFFYLVDVGIAIAYLVKTKQKKLSKDGFPNENHMVRGG